MTDKTPSPIKALSSKDRRPSPSQYMRAMRPYLFSDSAERQEPLLTETILEYQLDTLTSRSQEHDFEKFAHALAEREICPNLIPQTGPTSGGDSKSDAITHPVAETLVDRWFWGSARPVRSERWAFAFSLKKDWRSKVQDDVKKLAGLDTKPDRICFISNQFVRDKIRAEVEEALKQAHHIPVTIYDRQWIVRRVIDRGHHQLAIDTLHIAVPPSKEVRLGPNDAARKAELNALLTQLKAPDEHHPNEYTLAEDYLHAAYLARSLEHPQYETRHYHEQSIKFAKSFGSQDQIFRALYDYAWSAFWWFEDGAKTREIFIEIVEILKTTKEIEYFEKANNLWSLLFGSEMEQTGKLSEPSQQRRQVLISGLEYIAAQPGKPNAALQAKTTRAMLGLTESLQEKNINEAQQHIKSLCQHIKDSKGLLHYPADRYCDSLLSIGDYIGELPGYDDLVDTIQEITAIRHGETAQGRVVLKRAGQLQEAGRVTDAISAYKKAQILLSKQETIRACAVAMYQCGASYEHEGLLWAARNEVANSARLALREISGDDCWLSLAVRCSMKLAWIELQLGRLPWVLAWYYTAQNLMTNLLKTEDRETYEHIQKEIARLDGMTAFLFLKTSLAQLQHLTQLPDTLENIGLFFAEYALLYALGHTDELIRQQLPEKFTDATGADEFYKAALSNPGYDQIPTQVILHTTRREELKTSLLGCTITLNTDNETSCIILSETLLGVLEGLFVEATYNEFVFTRSTINIDIRKRDFTANPPEIRRDQASSNRIVEIAVADNFLKWVSTQGQKAMVDWCFSFIARLLGTEVIFAKDLSKTLEKVAKKGAFDRALSLVPSINSYALNPEQGFLDYWLVKSNKDYPVKRAQPWTAHLSNPTSSEPKEQVQRQEPRIMSGEPPDDVKNMIVKHSEMLVFDHIDVRLWDAAQWYGTALLRYPSPMAGLGFIFKNRTVGKEIFAAWRNRFGTVDEYEEIRIAIVEHVNDEGSYAVTIGGDAENILRRIHNEGKSSPKQSIVPSRCHQMDPEPGSQNLALFKKLFNDKKEFIIFPTTVDANGEMEYHFELAIKKKLITFKKMKELKSDDYDYRLVRLGQDGSNSRRNG